VIKKRGLFDTLDTEVKLPPVLNVQVWDNDTFTPDDFLGTFSINLSSFPKLFNKPEKCVMGDSRGLENLFATNESIRGWMPVYGKPGKDQEIKQTVISLHSSMTLTYYNHSQGKVEVELEVLLKDRAESNPVGLGRNGPNSLPLPE
jgi:C2 domain